MIYLVTILSWCTVKGFTQTAKVFRHTHDAPTSFQTERRPVYDKPVTVRVSLVGFSKRVGATQL
jgi:hypothetical protein